MLLEKPELLVLDEPTNHLDIETIAWLETYAINYSGAFDHRQPRPLLLRQGCDYHADLTKHSLDPYVGNYSSFVGPKGAEAG